MYTYKNARVFVGGEFIKTDISVDSGVFCASGEKHAGVFLDFNNCFIFPGFADVHVHLREPGFSYKETIHTGTMAAAHGGYTAVCSMPNLSPVPDSKANTEAMLHLIRKNAAVKVFPYAAITKEEKGEKLSDMEELSKLTHFFSDDGRGVQSESTMRSAMELAARLGVMIAAHCEDNAYLNGGCIRECEFALKNGHKTINPESEWRQVERDLRLAKETGCKYHICHISTKESVELVRRAKKDGVDVSAETAPHYLVLTTDNIEDDGRFKMNPPIGTYSDREALREGIADKTIDIIATDHAPHSKEEKSGGLKNSLMGITGLETAFPVLYTKLVEKNVISLERLIELLCVSPRKRFSLGGGEIRNGAPADFTVFDLENRFKINSAEFLSMGKSTPFDGLACRGRCLLTAVDGKIVWKAGRKNEANCF